MTIGDIINAARELSFDRFVTPTLYIGKAGANLTISITSTELKIVDASSTVITQLDFATYDTFRKLMDALITDSVGYEISYSASYISNEPTSSLLPLSASSLNVPIPVYRQYFFGDAKITKIVERYFEMMLGVDCSTVGTLDLNTEIANFKCHRADHMACWIAYWLVDERRLYEMAAESLGQSTFSFSNQAGLIGVSNDGSSISVNVGDVFTLTDNPGDNYNEGENPAGVGADNVLGDAKGFWYKLMLWLRSKIETLWGDYSLRKDNIMVGKIDLVIDRNFYAFYDSYPYTISPLAREVMSSFESNH